MPRDKLLPFKAEHVFDIILERQTIEDTCFTVDSLKGQIPFVHLMATEMCLKMMGGLLMSNNDFELCVCLMERK